MRDRNIFVEYILAGLLLVSCPAIADVLHWSAVTDAVSYNVYCRSNDNNWIAATPINSKVNQLDLSTSSIGHANKLFRCVVTAVSAQSESPFSRSSTWFFCGNGVCTVGYPEAPSCVYIQP